MSNQYALTNVQALLARAAAKTNDSSEEKHVTEFLNDIIADDSYDTEDKLRIMKSACDQMSEFCKLVIEEVEKDLHPDPDPLINALASISLMENDSTSSASEKVRSMAKTARDAIKKHKER